MSTTSAAVPRLVTAGPVASLVPALARQEARRLLLHPISLLGFAVYAFNVLLEIITDDGPRAAFETVNMLLTFFPGVFLILAANLVATRDRRAESVELLGPLPGRAGERTLALVLASFGPALVGLVLTIGLDAAFLLDGRYEVSPSVWNLLAGPVTLVGACCLGIMIAAWVPARGAAVVGLVVMVAVNTWLTGLEHGRLFGPAVEWTMWGSWPEQWAGLVPGSVGWHLVYLVGLCGMAGSAALVRVAERRTPVVVAGLVSLTVAVLAGIGQLP